MGKLLPHRTSRHQIRQRYVHNFAATLAGQIGMRWKELEKEFENKQSPIEIAQWLLKSKYAQEIYMRLDNQSDELLGKLVVGGVGESDRSWPRNGVAMFEVYGGEHWLSGKDDGESLALRIASVAVIAAMADNIWADLEKKKARDVHFEHTSELAGEIKGFRHGENLFSPLQKAGTRRILCGIILMLLAVAVFYFGGAMMPKPELVNETALRIGLGLMILGTFVDFSGVACLSDEPATA